MLIIGVIENIDKASKIKVMINKRHISEKLNIDLLDVIFKNSQKIFLDFIFFILLNQQ